MNIRCMRILIKFHLRLKGMLRYKFDFLYFILDIKTVEKYGPLDVTEQGLELYILSRDHNILSR